MKRNHRKNMVTLWDTNTNTFTLIPKSELAPGMVPCRIQGRKGVVWRAVSSIKKTQSPYRHPPFEGEMRMAIQSLVNAFPDIMEWSYEKWEDLLRKDTYPDQEIYYWMIVAKLFNRFASGKPLNCRKEVFRLLTVCNVTCKDAMPHVLEKDLLSASEVDEIIDAYYSHFAR